MEEKMQGITTSEIIQWLLSLLGGGLFGSIVSILFNVWNTNRNALRKEKGMIASLEAELRRSDLLCKHNAQLQGSKIAPFIHFPTIAAINVAFEERHSYPRTASIDKEIEYYTLAVMQINEMIDLYQSLITAHEDPPIEQDNLRNSIASICQGNSKLLGIGHQGFLVLPQYISSLSPKVYELLQKIS